MQIKRLVNKITFKLEPQSVSEKELFSNLMVIVNLICFLNNIEAKNWSHSQHF